ncbi:MAG: L-rhamnose mutarotase [Saccharofermentanales bacterium]
MIKKGIFFKVKSGKMPEYEEWHRNVWPGVIDILKKAGMRNYSIWAYDDLLFAYFEVEDEAKTNEILFGCYEFLEWRKEMRNIVYVEEGSGQVEWPMKLVFNVD